MLCYYIWSWYEDPNPPSHKTKRVTATVLLEFQIPPLLSKWAPFLFSFLGRGIFYIFVGSILLHDYVLRIIAGSIIGILGIGYAALEFVPSIEPPQNMREAGTDWGAEQI